MLQDNHLCTDTVEIIRKYNPTCYMCKWTMPDKRLYQQTLDKWQAITVTNTKLRKCQKDDYVFAEKVGALTDLHAIACTAINKVLSHIRPSKQVFKKCRYILNM